MDPAALAYPEHVGRGYLVATCCLLAACFSESTGGDTGSASAGSAGSSSGSASASASTSSSEGSSDTTRGVDSTADSSASNPSTTGSDDCAPQDTVPELAAGWTGPFILVPKLGGGDTPPPCPMALDGEGVASSGPAAQSCDCSCDPSCSAILSSSPGCGTEVDTLAIHGGCNATTGTGYVGAVGNDSSPGSCDAPVAAAATVTWEDQLRVCAGPASARCLERPALGLGPCIRHDGDQPCPDPSLARIVTHDDASATCSSCPDCGPAQASACGLANLVGYTGDACDGDATLMYQAASCSPMPVNSVDVAIPPPTCPPAEGTITGLVGTQTYCCTP